MTLDIAQDRHHRLGHAAVTALIVCGIIIIFVPLLLTIYLSFFDEKLIIFPPHGYTLSWYAAILPNFGDSIFISLELAFWSVAGSLLLGVPAGIALWRHRSRTTGAISTLLLAPLTVPGIALGLAIYLFLVLIEILTDWPLTGSLLGLILSHLVITMPWAVRLSVASLINHDSAAEEAAASLAGLFAFITSFGNLEMALFLVAPGVTTLPVAILQYLEYHIDPLIAAASVAQMALVAILLLILDRFVRLGQVVR